MFWAPTEKFHVRHHESFMLYNMKLLWQFRYLKVPCYLTQFFFTVHNDRICHVVKTCSRPITGVKKHRARLVVGLATAVKCWFTSVTAKTPGVSVVYNAESLTPNTYRCCNIRFPINKTSDTCPCCTRLILVAQYSAGHVFERTRVRNNCK
jgi:hypothetical protein